MKKLLLLLFVISQCIIWKQANAQFLKIQDKASNSDVTGVHHMLFFASSQNSFDLSLKVKNLTSSAKDIQVRRIYEQRLGGTVDFFCWDLCFDSLENLSGYINIPAGGSDSTSFHATYYPRNNNGTSMVRYKFLSTSGGSDTASVVVHYTTTPAGISEGGNYGFGVIRSIGPVPAGEQLWIKTNEIMRNFRVVCLDATGKVVLSETHISSDQVIMPTSQLSAGIYFLKVLDGNELKGNARFLVQ